MVQSTIEVLVSHLLKRAEAFRPSEPKKAVLSSLFCYLFYSPHLVHQLDLASLTNTDNLCVFMCMCVCVCVCVYVCVSRDVQRNAHL